MSLFSVDHNINHCNYWLYLNYLLVAMVLFVVGSTLHKAYNKKLNKDDGVVILSYIFSLMISFFQNRLLYSMCVNSIN